MAKETAIVTDLEGDYALVRTQRSAGCAACSERGLCSSMGGGKDMEFLAANPVNAKQGDTVLLDFKAMRLLQLSFLLYIFPILLLVTGAVIGDQMAPAYGIDRSIGAAGLGFAAFFAAMGMILLVERRAKKIDTYKPVILAVKRPGPAQTPPENCNAKI
jgi:sigma-E factor negative regulatory protein RseC